MMIGIAVITIHAPRANFVIVTMTRTTPVVPAPIPLMIALRSHRPSRNRIQRRTIPACDSVNAVNTPTT